MTRDELRDMLYDTIDSCVRNEISIHEATDTILAKLELDNKIALK